MDAVTHPDGYGGFTLGPMQLALPMSALREVVPCRDLSSLPCAATCVVGGTNLRGVVVPVVDLRVLLGRDCSDIAEAGHPNIIIMVHGGRLLGLLADGVTGVFAGAAGGLHRASVSDPVATVFAGSMLRADDNTLVSVLSPEALSTLHQVPMIDDPEPARQQVAGDSASVVIDDRGVPMTLVRCNRVSLAIDAMAVHSTLSNPVIDRSTAAVGNCRGLIDYAGCRVPVVDLLALCGLGRHDEAGSTQAFVMQLDDGFVALLVEEVIDVVRTVPEDVVLVPAFALPEPMLFAGALPVTVFPADSQERLRKESSQFLLLDSAALKAWPALVALAKISSQREVVHGSATATAGSGATPDRRAMITFDLFGETATPIEQVAEILPFQPEATTFDAQGAMLGLVVNRGRSIPLVCLRRLAGQESPELTPESSVLVVQSESEWMGFAVPQLRTIEDARWEPSLPEHGPGQRDALMQSLQSRKLALVGSGTTERMLRVLDLQGIARSLRAQKTTNEPNTPRFSNNLQISKP